MVLFNYVDTPEAIKCPCCQTFLKNWRTFEDGGYLEKVDYKTVDKFYTSCIKCHVYYEINKRPPKSDEYEPMKGYAMSVW